MADPVDGDAAHEVERAVAEALRAAGRPVDAVEGAHRLSGGASRHTWALTARQDGASSDLVVQIVRPGSIDTGGGLEAEARLLGVAGAAGVPVPQVVAHVADGEGPLGRPFLVVTRVPGETIARRILRDERWGPAREVLVGQCASALAAVHAIPPGDVGPLPTPDPVEQMRAVLDGFGEPYPAFELALRWLDANRPGAVDPRVLHGDFRLGNLIVDEGGLAAVIDWELSHLGDPLADLAWLSTKAWRFGAPLPVAGLGSYELLFTEYQAAGGSPVDLDAFRWWQVHSALRWGVICVIQVMAHLRRASRSVELAAIGRRTAEQDWDLLELLA